MNLKETKKNLFPFSRLQWACRRGMLELDVLLNNFLNEVYAGLGDADQQAFVQLLTYPDPVLFTWLMGQALPSEDDLLRIVEKIRLHARSRI